MAANGDKGYGPAVHLVVPIETQRKPEIEGYKINKRCLRGLASVVA